MSLVAIGARFMPAATSAMNSSRVAFPLVEGEGILDGRTEARKVRREVAFWRECFICGCQRYIHGLMVDGVYTCHL